MTKQIWSPAVGTVATDSSIVVLLLGTHGFTLNYKVSTRLVKFKLLPDLQLCNKKTEISLLTCQNTRKLALLCQSYLLIINLHPFYWLSQSKARYTKKHDIIQRNTLTKTYATLCIRLTQLLPTAGDAITARFSESNVLIEPLAKPPHNSASCSQKSLRVIYLLFQD